MDKVVLRKNGGFYSVYGNDCYILNYLFGYKIIDDRVGFPISAYEKVLKALEDNHINYEVGIENYNCKKKNNYNKILDLGIKRCKLKYRIDKIIEKLNLLTEKQIEEILNYIEKYER